MQVINPTCHLIDAKDKTFDLDLISKETTKYNNDVASIKKQLIKCAIYQLSLEFLMLHILDVNMFDDTSSKHIMRNVLEVQGNKNSRKCHNIVH